MRDLESNSLQNQLSFQSTVLASYSRTVNQTTKQLESLNGHDPSEELPEHDVVRVHRFLIRIVPG